MTRVLVVDDKEENLYYLSALLSGHGHDVESARHGAEALVLARRSPPDIVISDLLMPVMDGYTLLRHWKADSLLRSIPFIVYTATYTEVQDERLALDLGADAFILKPAEPDEFLERMHEVLGRAQVSAPLSERPGADEETLLATYSQTLIRKLEEKTLQLERANEQLRADIVERERVETALRQSEAEIRTLIAAIPHIVWITSDDGAQVEFNQRWFDYTGLSADECQGGRWVQALHPSDRDTSRLRWLEAVEATKPFEVEYRMRRSDGTYRWMLGRALPLVDEHGAAVKWFGTCTDIDDMKRAETQLLRTQRMESIGTLAGGIAHDLNNVLAPIMVGTELLLEHPGQDEERTRELLETMSRSAARAAHLVRQVLSFARGVEGDREPVSLRAVVDEVIRMVGTTFPRNIAVSTDLPADLWNVIGDSTQLNQVVLNLCVNARDAMPDGGRLHLAAENLDLDAARITNLRRVEPGRYTLLRISDTGSGIEPQLLDRIFEPFLTTKATGGSGLGLSTALGIVTSHGGSIDVTSEPGQGSEFSVFLPATTERELEPTSGGNDATPTHGRGQLVLVVDDEPAILETVALVLQRHGYRVVTANNASDARALYAERADDIAAALVDVMMPEVDGTSLLAELRTTTPDLPAILMSGLTPPSPEIAHFLPKPFSAEQLLSAIHAALVSDPHSQR